MSWLGRGVVYAGEDGKLYAGIVCGESTMNEVYITIFEPYRIDTTVRGRMQDGPWDYMPGDCWLAQDYDDEGPVKAGLSS